MPPNDLFPVIVFLWFLICSLFSISNFMSSYAAPRILSNSVSSFDFRRTRSSAAYSLVSWFNASTSSLSSKLMSESSLFYILKDELSLFDGEASGDIDSYFTSSFLFSPIAPSDSFLGSYCVSFCWFWAFFSCWPGSFPSLCWTFAFSLSFLSPPFICSCLPSSGLAYYFWPELDGFSSLPRSDF